MAKWGFTMKRWFHKEDGGLITVERHVSPAYDHGCATAYCSACDERWLFTGIRKGAIVITVSDKDFGRFSDLSEGLQAAALSEML